IPKRVYFAKKVTSLGKDWHRPCLRCKRCGKTLTPSGHAEHDGQPLLPQALLWNTLRTQGSEQRSSGQLHLRRP
uniref:LIM zinc-binding domain-containing protein n=1 Tax=Oryctolagus cuniculus TaxID=9986 RepID=A0A5F9CZ99_RABIT